MVKYVPQILTREEKAAIQEGLENESKWTHPVIYMS